MKTVHEIVEEYKNRQKDPKYILIDVKTDEMRILKYGMVTNLKKTWDNETGWWLEFDCISGGINVHVKVKGFVVRYEADQEQVLL